MTLRSTTPGHLLLTLFLPCSCCIYTPHHTTTTTTTTTASTVCLRLSCRTLLEARAMSGRPSGTWTHFSNASTGARVGCAVAVVQTHLRVHTLLLLRVLATVPATCGSWRQLPQRQPPSTHGTTCVWQAICFASTVVSSSFANATHRAHTRPRRYWHDKGLVCIITGRALNLAALGFTIAFSGACVWLEGCLRRVKQEHVGCCPVCALWVCCGI